jgi:hypothetical protein
VCKRCVVAWSGGSKLTCCRCFHSSRRLLLTSAQPSRRRSLRRTGLCVYRRWPERLAGRGSSGRAGLLARFRAALMWAWGGLEITAGGVEKSARSRAPFQLARIGVENLAGAVASHAGPVAVQRGAVERILALAG